MSIRVNTQTAPWMLHCRRLCVEACSVFTARTQLNWSSWTLATTWLAAAKLGRLVLSELWTRVSLFQCGYSCWSELEFMCCEQDFSLTTVSTCTSVLCTRVETSPARLRVPWASQDAALPSPPHYTGTAARPILTGAAASTAATNQN